MESTLQFLFREKLFTCEVCIDCADDPFFIFMILNDQELIAEFGDEITIKTDFINLLQKRDDFEQLTVLRQCIFDCLKFHPMFIQAKTKKMREGNKNLA